MQVTRNSWGKEQVTALLDTFYHHFVK